MMSTPVMFVLSALMVTMVTCYNVVPPCDLPPDRLVGEWFIMATATNGWNINNGWSDRVNNTAVEVANWTPQEAHWPRGGYKFTYRWPLFPFPCISLTIDWLRMRPCLFMYYDLINNVYFEMEVLDYNSTLIFPPPPLEPVLVDYVVLKTTALHPSNPNNEQFFLDLYTRDVPLMNNDMKMKFLHIAKTCNKDHGIPAANVTFLGNDGRCGIGPY